MESSMKEPMVKVPVRVVLSVIRLLDAAADDLRLRDSSFVTKELRQWSAKLTKILAGH